jgi:thioredoxin reductase (NADPH)
VRLADGHWLEAGAVLVATGVRRRRRGVPGEREFGGRGVTGSATRDRAQLAGRRVVIVGGGDGAYENALLLAAAGSEVTLLVRGAVRARAEFRARVEAEPRVTVRTGLRVVAIEGGEHVRAVRVTGAAGEASLEAEGVVIKAGSLPNTEWCGGALALDADGFVRVDDAFATSAPRVWAAGDVTRPVPATVSVSAGQGTRAAAMIRAALRG